MARGKHPPTHRPGRLHGSWLAGLWLIALPALAGDLPILTVHLPRTVTLKSSSVTLGQICVIHGEDASEALARPIALGRLYSPDQELTLTHQQILSRLVCTGLDASRIRITGADRVVINRSAIAITGAEIIALAQRYLESRLGANHQAIVTPIRKPKDLRLGQGKQRARLVPRLVGRGTPSQVRVKVSALVAGTEQDARDVLFRIQYPHRIAVATRDLPAETILTPDHFKIETELKGKPEPVAWKPPVGLITQKAIKAGTVFTDRSARRPIVPVAIKRNEVVVIRIQNSCLTITAMGRALSEARTGEVIKIKNADSNRIIVCRVQEDGTVTPVL